VSGICRFFRRIGATLRACCLHLCVGLIERTRLDCRAYCGDKPCALRSGAGLHRKAPLVTSASNLRFGGAFARRAGYLE